MPVRLFFTEDLSLQKMKNYTRTILISVVLCMLMACKSDKTRFKSNPDFDRFEASINRIMDEPNPEIKTQRLHTFYDSLISEGSIPFIAGDAVAFLFKGDAESVNWHGDFDGWTRAKEVRTSGSRIAESNLWTLRKNYPLDARLDYKIVLDDVDWILDPANANIQISGFGPNSVLSMTQWKPSVYVHYNPETPAGILTTPELIKSEFLDLDVQFHIYLPANYALYEPMPVLYVTDGHEYSNAELGALPTVLDNMIASGIIPPLIVCFVDPRLPSEPSTNLREMKFLMNPDYLRFFSDELIPLVESTYKVDPDRSKRGIMGTSFGGVNATYFALSNTDLFGLAAVQSPSYRQITEIFDLPDASDELKARFFITSGTFFDGKDYTDKMVMHLENAGYELQLMVVEEGHSWGAWRNQFENILPYLYRRE